MAFIQLTQEELEDLKILSQDSIYFDNKTGVLDSSKGFKFIEETINPSKTEFIIKYENLDAFIQNIYAIMNKTVHSGTEYANLSETFSCYKLYKRV